MKNYSFIIESKSEFSHKFGPVNVQYSINEEDLKDPFMQKLIKIDLFPLIGKRIIKYLMSLNKEWKLNLTPEVILKSIQDLKITLFPKYARITVFHNLEPDVYPVFKIHYNMSVEQIL